MAGAWVSDPIVTVVTMASALGEQPSSLPGSPGSTASEPAPGQIPGVEGTGPRALPRLALHALGAVSLPSIGELAQRLREKGPRERFALVVPTRSALEHAKNEVARLVGAVDPRGFHTVLGLAKRLLGAKAPKLASPRVRDALLERALREVELPDLRSAARFRGYRRALLGLFSELESAGLGPSQVEKLLGGSRRRAELDRSRPDRRNGIVHERIVSGYRAYRAALRRGGLAVEGDVLEQAAQALERGTAATSLPDLVLVDGFMDLTPRQLELVTAIARHAPETVVHWPRREVAPGVSFGALERGARALAGRGFVALESPLVGASVAPAPRAPAVEHVVRSLFRPSGEPLASTGGAVSFVRAGSPEDEAQVALRIARQKVLRRDFSGESARASEVARSWNDVLIVVPDARAVRATFERAAHELGVPIRVHAARALAAHPAVQGALAFARAAVTLEAQALVAAALVPALGLDAAAADRLAREVGRQGVPSGREALAALASDGSGGAGLPIEAKSLVRDVLALSRRLDASNGGAIDAGEGLAELRALLTPRLARPVVRDLAAGGALGSAAIEAASDEVAALDAFLDLLGELESLFRGEKLTPRALLARLEEEVREADFTPRDRRRHVVHVVDFASARTFQASTVVIAGLAEGAFPRPARDDLLDEGVRRAAVARGIGLATADDHAEGDQLLFLSAVASARDELHLVSPGFDAHGEPRPASPFVAAVESLFRESAVAEARIRRSPSDVVAPALADLATPGDARRFALLRAASSFRPDAPDAAGREAEARARRGAALLGEILARAGDAGTGEPGTRDGFGPTVRAALATPSWSLGQGPGARVLDRVFSASELETYATCPYRHFVRHVLGIRRREDLATTGLDARLQGKIVHQALERAIRLGQPAGAAFDAAFAEGVRDLPLGPDEEAFRRAARAAVVGFLESDDPEFLARAGLAASPSKVEVAFGPKTDLGPLLVTDPVLDGQIQLEGRIDRIDEGPRGAFVTDYKLGSEAIDGRARVALAKGEKLQIPVYLLALARVVKQVPLGAALVALGTRRRTGIVGLQARDLAGESARVALAPVDLEQILAAAEESIRAIVRGIAAGTIDAAPREPGDCRRCEVRDVCRFAERPGSGARGGPGRALPRAGAAPVAARAHAGQSGASS